MAAQRVMVVSASMGAGHDSAATELAARLRLRGAQVERVDFLSLPQRREGDAVRAFYQAMIRHAPRAYGAVMSAWLAWPWFFERVTSLGGGAFERPLRARIQDFGPDVVVSTYNLAAQSLGRLRHSGSIRARTISYVTDPGAHPYWVAPGVDLHLAPLQATAEQLRGFGAESVEVVAPLVGPPSRTPDRARWQLPTDTRAVVISGGSWGVGTAARTAEQLCRVEGVAPVVLCGHSAELHQRVSKLGCHAIGWTDDVPSLLASSDVVVDNAGGTTSWEALAAGRPVIVHQPIPGHGRLNAATLVEAGLAVTTTGFGDLADAALHLTPPDAAAAVFAEPDAAELVAAQ